MTTFDFSKSDKALENQLYGLIEQGIDLECHFDPSEFAPREARRLKRLFGQARLRFDHRQTRQGVQTYTPPIDTMAA